VFAPLCFLEKNFVGIFGEDRKSRSSDCFSVMASLSVHRFDRALAYDVFFFVPYCLLFVS
jgi:hypothetical protein